MKDGSERRDQMRSDEEKRGDILIDADLWKILYLEEIGHDLDLLAQLAVVSAFLETADLHRSEFAERDGGHGRMTVFARHERLLRCC
jgi:hypothetical protein